MEEVKEADRKMTESTLAKLKLSSAQCHSILYVPRKCWLLTSAKCKVVKVDF